MPIIDSILSLIGMAVSNFYKIFPPQAVEDNFHFLVDEMSNLIKFSDGLTGCKCPNFNWMEKLYKLLDLWGWFYGLDVCC